VICRNCGKPYSKEEIEAKRKKKSMLISLARKEADLTKDNKCYNKKYDRTLMIELRKHGLSIREIAKRIGCSTSPVVAALRDSK